MAEDNLLSKIGVFLNLRGFKLDVNTLTTGVIKILATREHDYIIIAIKKQSRAMATVTDDVITCIAHEQEIRKNSRANIIGNFLLTEGTIVDTAQILAKEYNIRILNPDQFFADPALVRP